MGKLLISLPSAPSLLPSSACLCQKGLHHELGESFLWASPKLKICEIKTWKDNKVEIALEEREGELAINYLLGVGDINLINYCIKYITDTLLLVTA